jgi:hypothetical protein
MLVILTDDQIFAPEQICQSCLLANKSGQPRWHEGKLSCGQAIPNYKEKQPQEFECIMGFRLANIR